MDVLASDERLDEDLERKDDREKVMGYLFSALTDREREIVTLRYGLAGGEPLTQREVAERYGISRSYISRIEKRALQKLRTALDGRA